METSDRNETVFDRDEQRHHKRMAVLQAAARLFRERGFMRTSLDDIAGELNVTKRTLYYYVSNKDEILFDCIRQALDFMRDVLHESKQGQEPAIVKIEIMMRKYAQMLKSDFGACLVLRKNEVMSEDNRLILQQGYKEIDLALRTLLNEGVEDGSVTPCNLKYTAATIFGAFNWVPNWYRNSEEHTYEEITDHLLATLLNGVRPR
jgi:AcrR family transcriptional regulator